MSLLVELNTVQQCYGDFIAVKHLNLSLARGEVLGLFGHNGAGKTTTMKLILGLIQPCTGRVSVFGHNPGDANVRRKLGYLPENVTFYPQLTGQETLAHFARLKDAPRHQVAALLQQVGLSHAAGRKVKTYSKGMRQRLGLAQALLGTPDLLLLDEPTVGLDPVATAELYQLIEQLRGRGTGIILCSHVLSGVERYIDRAAILAQGELQATGSLAQLRQHAQLPTLIRASGLPNRNHWHSHLTENGHIARLYGEHGLEVQTQHDTKTELLQTLLNQGQAKDIEIIQPSLEALYLHYQPSDNRISMGA
ncbi:ABC transporter ATP-binding protein [Chromatiaceae bacterium AAb-1]|nr:ABC transporter ATP-binding protein [Chromatiaceae bacterium AAb-1]